MVNEVLSMEINEAIAIRIKELCKRDNLTINGLSIKAGITQSTIDNIIKGNSKNPCIKTLILIANTFNLTIIEFLNTEEILKSFVD